ncbi:MAG TPA: 2OG-Fe(II) oxygenase [Polyangiaceae bacterium]|nr:2OG-Fe(II) oxygenase [Polyangiaceae bacterium]
MRERFLKAQPFPFLAVDDFLEPEFARAMAASYPSFEDASSLGHVFNAVNEKRKVQITNPESFPEPVQQFAALAASEEFREFLSKVSGIDDLRWDDSYSGAGMHMTASSGRLDVHVDFNRLEQKGWYRRLNLLLFLNEGWQDEWGGRLELWNADVTKCAHSFQPIFNRMVLFETSDISYHGVTPIKCPPAIARRSFALYFYTEQPPAGVDADKQHSTIFRSRPNEFMRGYVLMPLSSASWALRSAYRTMRSRTAQLLGLKRA